MKISLARRGFLAAALSQVLAASLAGAPAETPVASPSSSASPPPATAIHWKPEADLDRQLYPALIIATATRRPDDTRHPPSPDLLGDRNGLLGISIRSSQPNTRIKVTVHENEILNTSVWTGTVPQADRTYFIAPYISYKFDALRHTAQQQPLSVQFDVEFNGQTLPSKAETVTLRSINDCPYALSYSAADEEKDVHSGTGHHPLGLHGGSESAVGWMFSAYVNEDHPLIDALLNEALHTGIINDVDGYQDGKPEEVLRQAYAVWKVLQDRGVRYSDISTNPGGSGRVKSQYVRFVEESLRQQQANCVDGSVLFASVLRKMGLAAFLVVMPHHMYVGVELSPKANDNSVACIETTLLGAGEQDLKVPTLASIDKLEQTLKPGERAAPAWKTFRTAVCYATAVYNRDKKKLDDENNSDYLVIDVADARANGIMPIPFDRPDRAPELPGGPTHAEPTPPQNGETPKPTPTPFVKEPSDNPEPKGTPKPSPTPESNDGGAAFEATRNGGGGAPRPAATPRSTPGGNWFSTTPTSTPAPPPRPRPSANNGGAWWQAPAKDRGGAHQPTPKPSASASPRSDDFGGFFQ